LAFDQDHQIVGITGKAQPPTFQFPVQVIEQDVSQQRRERTPLRGSQLAGFKLLSHHRAGAKVGPDQGQQLLVAHPSSHSGHQDVVVHMVEKFRQIQIHGDAKPGLHKGLYLSQGSMRATVGSKPETRRREIWVEDRAEDLRNGLLDQSIEHVGDSQRPLPGTVALGDKGSARSPRSSPSRTTA
jgi:hypothetical protein